MEGGGARATAVWGERHEEKSPGGGGGEASSSRPPPRYESVSVLNSCKVLDIFFFDILKIQLGRNVLCKIIIELTTVFFFK